MYFINVSLTQVDFHFLFQEAFGMTTFKENAISKQVERLKTS